MNPVYRPIAVTLGLVIFFHILLTNLGGDEDPRHAIALEPFYWLLAWGGLKHAYESIR